MDDSCPPAGAMRLTVRSERDRQGRCAFDLEWRGYRMDGRWGLRAQCFRGDPDEYVRDLGRRGWTILRTALT